MFLNLEEYYTELGGARNNIFKRNVYYKCDETLENKITAFRQQYRNTDVFQCLYQYSALEEKPLLYAPFYLDLDADITSEKKFRKIIPYVARAFLGLRQIGLQPEEIQLYFSGSKGFHLTVSPFVLGIVPSYDLNALYKAWALYLSHTYDIPIIDLRIYDKRRLFRMPNSINSKTGCYKVPVTIEYLFRHSHEELLAYAAEPKEDYPAIQKINKVAALYFYKKSQHYKKKKEPKQEVTYQIPEAKQELLPCIRTILEEGAIQGARNNTLIILASGLLQSGYQIDEVEHMALQWNQLNEPPLSESETLVTVRSAASMLHNGRRYGCASIREMGLCSSNECRLGGKDGN